MEFERERNLLSLIVNVSLSGDDVAKNYEFIEHTLRSHRVLGKIPQRKSLTKFQARVLALLRQSPSTTEVGMRLLLLLVDDGHNLYLDRHMKQLLLHLNENIKKMLQSSATTVLVCRIVSRCGVRLKELSSETIKEISPMLGQIISSVVSLLDETNMGTMLSSFIAIVQSSPGILRQCVSNIEKQCLRLLFQAKDKVVCEEAAQCMALMTKMYSKPHVSGSEWIDVRMLRCIGGLASPFSM